MEQQNRLWLSNNSVNVLFWEYYKLQMVQHITETDREFHSEFAKLMRVKTDK
jgi:hypothetical protein